MNITNNQPIFTRESFGLGEDGQVADQTQFYFGLQALIDRPLEAIREPQLVERVFKTISETDLANWPEAAKVKKLVADVKDHWVKVSLGDSFRHIPRVRLEKDCGPKFKAQYTARFAEASKHELTLTLPENAPSEHYPAKLTESFLSHLQTGEVSEDGFDEDILNLLNLAILHTQEPLVAGCVNFLAENLDFDNLDSTLAYANESSLPQLKWACLLFMQENELYISTELEQKYRTQLDLVISLQEQGIKLRFSPSGLTELYIAPLRFQPPPSLLKRIADEIPIHSIVIDKDEVNPLPLSPLPFLVQVAPYFPELQELIIYDKEPTHQVIPNLKVLFPQLKAFGNDAPFLETFEEVETYLHRFTKPGTAIPGAETTTLRSLNLTLIGNLDDSQMDKLREYLQDIYHLVIHSEKITSVVAPNATKITCLMCTALTTLAAPNAREINCNGCSALTTLPAPRATSINCFGCTALTMLDAPNATYIYCVGCSALTKLDAPQATEIHCRECPVLETITAPSTTKTDCSGYSALTTLDAPLATHIDCLDCSALTTLSLPQVTQIDCTDCSALTTLSSHID